MEYKKTHYLFRYLLIFNYLIITQHKIVSILRNQPEVRCIIIMFDLSGEGKVQNCKVTTFGSCDRGCESHEKNRYAPHRSRRKQVNKLLNYINPKIFHECQYWVGLKLFTRSCHRIYHLPFYPPANYSDYFQLNFILLSSSAAIQVSNHTTHPLTP